MNETYIGDGVYCTFDGFHFWLYTSNGIEITNKIALEPEVLSNFIAFVKACGVEIND